MVVNLALQIFDEHFKSIFGNKKRIKRLNFKDVFDAGFEERY